MPVSKGERNMRDRSWFSCEGVTGGCNGAAACGGGRQPESGGFWIDLRWKTTSWANWAERLFGLDTVVKIKQAAEIE
jgi:hypothetical protein